MNEFLLFTLYSPMSAWGEIAVGEIRSSKSHPGRSALFGLIAAAFGIKRDDAVNLNNLHDSFGLAVKVVSTGHLVNDFHTVQAARTQSRSCYRTRADELNAGTDLLGTIVSTREYRSDAMYVVALWKSVAQSQYTLQGVSNALLSPVFIPYLGRKSCPPACKFVPQIISAETLKDAFDQYGIKPVWFAMNNTGNAGNLEKRVFKIQDEVYYWDECDNSGLEKMLSTERYDKVLDASRRQFRSRREFLTIIKKEEV